MRKAPAPGVDGGGGRGLVPRTHPPHPAPDRGRCRKDARECCFCCTQVTAVLLGPHCRAPPPSGPDPRLSRALNARVATAGRQTGTPLSRRRPAPMEGKVELPHPPHPAGGRGLSGLVAGGSRQRLADRDHRVQGTYGGPGVIALKTRPGKLSPSVERADAEGRLFLRASSGRWSVRGAERFHVRRPDEPYGPAEQCGRDVRCGTRREPRDAPRAAPAKPRGPVEFADAASGRSTPTGVAACNDRTSEWLRRDSCPGSARGP